MNEQIPVGSPPVPPGRHAAPTGWYADPVDPARERWWDGWQWSRQTRESETPAPAPRSVSTTRTPPTSYAPGPTPPYGAGPAGVAPYGPPNGVPGPAPLPPRRQTADGVALSGWWRRVGAVMIDWVIVTVIATLMLLGVYAGIWERFEPIWNARLDAALAREPLPAFDASTVVTESDQITVTLVIIAVGLIYNIGLLIWRGQTVGKLAAGIRVVPAGVGAHQGGLPWRSAVVRSLIWVVPGQVGLLLAVRVLDALWPLRDPASQALHDKAARTQVIRTR